MNPTTTTDPTAPPPPPPTQPPRSSFSCDRHPDEQFSGFCPSCLCERLTVLDKSSSNTPSSSRRPSSASAAAAAAIKSLFSSSKSTNATNNYIFPPPPKPSKSTTFLPELRRSKSFSASKNEALGLCSFEPQRKSCDVRGRNSNSNTLLSLFTQENEKKAQINTNCKPSASSSQNGKQYESSYVANEPVLEEHESEEEYKDTECIEVADEDEEDEITQVQDYNLGNLRNYTEPVPVRDEITPIQDYNLGNLTNSTEPVANHIDFDINYSKLDTKKSSGGRFWAAASVFSKKWHGWRSKQKLKKHNNGENSTTLPVEKPISTQFRETQSEIADYGFGRRSCDTDPRFSLDVGRISFDGPRYSFEEPRASWDGHLIGRNFPKMAPMVSLMEDSPKANVVTRSDMQIPVEENIPETKVDESVPGGSVQTREYYSDSFSRRRKSLDRSSSVRKSDVEAVNLSPKNNGSFRDSNSNSNSFRDDCSETFELGSGLTRKVSKKSKSWRWKLWGFINRRGGNKNEDGDRYSSVNGLNHRSFSEKGSNRKVLRSNSSVSWRNSNHFGGSFNGGNRGSEFVFEKNRSGRYSSNNNSSNNNNNGLLRVYLTESMRGSRREGLAKIKPSNSHSIARSVLRLY